MRLRMAAALGAAMLLAASARAPSVSAAEVVIYRCTDASGALTVQNGTPCPKGAKQERTVVVSAPTMPVYVPSATPPPPPRAPEVPAATPAPAPPGRPDAPPPKDIAAADRLPPPPIHECNTFDGGSYISEDPAPKPRCVRIATTGVGGLDQLGAGAACEMKYDQCQRVPDQAACDGWKRRQREVESTWRHAKGEDKAPLQDEFARIATILSDTTCGG